MVKLLKHIIILKKKKKKIKISLFLKIYKRKKYKKY